MSAQMHPIEMTTEEAVERGATDGHFWAHFFLPKTFPLYCPLDEAIWAALDRNPRFFSAEMFRDGGKTTKLRAANLRRMCYGLTEFTMVVSESENHSKWTLAWFKNQVIENERLASTYGLVIGDKDSELELEIWNKTLNIKIIIIAKGITGQLRGFNKNDKRPDTILCDDLQTMENAGTPELIQAIGEKFWGSVVQALASEELCPHAMLMYAGTRCGMGDILQQVALDSRWVTLKFSIFTEDGKSAWPQKWSTQSLHVEKQSYIDKNMLDVWMREKECVLIKGSSQAFKPEWIQVFHVLPQRYTLIGGLDPVPPPSKAQIAKGLKNKDWEVFTIIALDKGRVFVDDQIANRGHEIEWTIHTYIQLLQRYKTIRAFGVESVAYQLTIARQMQKAMRVARRYCQIVEITDPRGKYYRITGEIAPYCYDGNLFIRDNQTSLAEQFAGFPSSIEHDDHLDSLAMAIMAGKQVTAELPDDPEDDPFSTQNDRDGGLDYSEMTLCP